VRKHNRPTASKNYAVCLPRGQALQTSKTKCEVEDIYSRTACLITAATQPGMLGEKGLQRVIGVGRRGRGRGRAGNGRQGHAGVGPGCARFCHPKHGKVWSMKDRPKIREMR